MTQKYPIIPNPADDILPIYGSGIEPDRIYHLKGDTLQMFLWFMCRFYQAGQSGDALYLATLQQSARERIENIVAERR